MRHNDGEHQHGPQEDPRPVPAIGNNLEPLRDYEPGRVPPPEEGKRGFPFLPRNMRWRPLLKNAFQFITGLMIVVLFFVWAVFGAQTIAVQNRQIGQETARIIAIHGQASAERSCASTELLAFIIRIGNQRAHELGTGSYLTPKQKRTISSDVRAACKYEAPTLDGETG